MYPVTISVVIPAYNAAPYIREALESVLAQSYTNFEVIVVDDGSVDNTAQIVRDFGTAVRLVQQKNRGLAAARNAAIKEAQGEIIAPLDADDLWEPVYLEIMIDFLLQHQNAVAAYCGFRYISAAGVEIGRSASKVVPSESFHETLLGDGNWLIPSAVIFYKNMAERVGLFDEEISPVADAGLWMNLSAHSPFVGLPNQLVKYRRHGENMSNDPKLMVSANARLIEKIFGAPSDASTHWSPQKRQAYTKLFSSGALQYLASGNTEESTRYFLRLLELAPLAVLQLQFWRAVSRLHIPQEYQLDPAVRTDLSKSKRDVFRLLHSISMNLQSKPRLKPHFQRITSAAFLGLADEAGRNSQFSLAAEWLLKAARANPQIALSKPYWGTVLRSTAKSFRKESLGSK